LSLPAFLKKWICEDQERTKHTLDPHDSPDLPLKTEEPQNISIHVHERRNRMKGKRIFIIFALVMGLTLIGVVIVSASNLAAKPYVEGEGALQTGQRANGDTPDKPYPEGEGALSTGSRVGLDSAKSTELEGSAGSAGTGSLENANAKIANATGALSVLYQFSGVTDDGQQGSASRKEATTIHCTNVASGNVLIEVQLYQWNGTDVYTGTVNMPPNRTFAFSTQNTTIYFDDVLLGGSPGTPAIFQGSGRVLTDNPAVICSAQVLDPLNYPPVFVAGLEMFQP
jgi:hypothetical protein